MAGKASGQRRELSRRSHDQAVTQLARQHPMLRLAVERWGPPPFWTHPPGFAGLTLAILGQQVSIESAAATFRKLEAAIGELRPAALLGLDDGRLRALGFSRQKAGYVRGIAGEILAGRLDLDGLAALDDEAARTRLLALRGVGRWTADTYLLFAMRRADAWPSGDIALEMAIAELQGRSEKLATVEADELALAWQPLRAVAARILWCHYLKQRDRFQAD